MHVCDTRSFSAISRVVLWRIRDPNRLLLRLGRHQFQLDDQSVFRLWVKNHQNEICQINFDTVVLLRLRRHKQHITFCELAMRFSLCENKKAKYDDNVPFDFPFFNENYATDQKIFFTDWQLNCQLSNNKNVFYIWTTPANLKIQPKPSMSEIRNYLVANPIECASN